MTVILLRNDGEIRHECGVAIDWTEIGSVDFDASEMHFTEALAERFEVDGEPVDWSETWDRLYCRNNTELWQSRDGQYRAQIKG